MTRKVGVVGAGTMGQGIANAFATAGNDVIVVDVKKNGLKTASTRFLPARTNSLPREKSPRKQQMLPKQT